MYKRHRIPPEIIQYAVWLYHGFSLNHRDIEDLMPERGIVVSYEAIRLWCNKFGTKYTRRLRRKHQGYGDTFFIDEMFVKIQGNQHYFRRAVNQDGEAVDVFLQKRRDAMGINTGIAIVNSTVSVIFPAVWDMSKND
jgi:putative transposase